MPPRLTAIDVTGADSPQNRIAEVPEGLMPLLETPHSRTSKQPIDNRLSYCYYPIYGDTITPFREHCQAEIFPMLNLDNRIVCWYLVHAEHRHTGAASGSSLSRTGRCYIQYRLS
jgi:hypothetical protein